MKKHKQNKEHLDQHLSVAMHDQLTKFNYEIHFHISGQISAQISGQLYWELKEQLYWYLKVLTVEEVSGELNGQ